MERKTNAKIAIHCGRAMSRLFYKFLISTDPLKFCEMQLLDDDDLGTMMEIWWLTGSDNTQPVELFIELADLEPIENVSPKSQPYGTKADVEEGTNNGEDSNQDVEDFSDLDIDEVPDNIDDEDPNEV
ncbi:hypothetical protein GOBAR_DD30307 [Gossypium barbadense]|nr:hypothetical protein GOBAR_DD30307 [Gossypium barbadense]